MSKEHAGRVGVAPSHCGVCGRPAALRPATRDDTMTCEECWPAYEASCDEEDAYWLSQVHPALCNELERTSAAGGAPDDAQVQGEAPIPGQLLPWLLIVAAWARCAERGSEHVVAL